MPWRRPGAGSTGDGAAASIGAGSRYDGGWERSRHERSEVEIEAHYSNGQSSV